MRKTIAVVSLAAALSLTPVAAASVQAHEVTAGHSAVQPTPAPNQDNDDGGGNRGLNGLWGLLGLAGLLGLIPRKPKVQQPGYAPHVADTARTESREYRGDTGQYRGDVPRNPRADS